MPKRKLKYQKSEAGKQVRGLSEHKLRTCREKQVSSQRLKSGSLVYEPLGKIRGILTASTNRQTLTLTHVSMGTNCRTNSIWCVFFLNVCNLLLVCPIAMFVCQARDTLCPAMYEITVAVSQMDVAASSHEREFILSEKYLKSLYILVKYHI